MASTPMGSTEAQVREVDEFLLHLDENMVSILRRRNNFLKFMRERIDIKADGTCSCCGFINHNPSMESLIWLVNDEATAHLIYQFAILLNSANSMGLAKEIDIYFTIGELAMVVSYDSRVGAIPFYYYFPEREIRLCSYCYSNIVNKKEIFQHRFQVTPWDDQLIKEPETD